MEEICNFEQKVSQQKKESQSQAKDTLMLRFAN